MDDRDLGVTPVMVSLFTPAEIPWWRPAWDVAGLQLCLPYGSCQNMAGLDLGVVTHAASSQGFQIAAVNVIDNECQMSLSVGGLVNVVGGSYSGLQIGGLVNVVGNTFEGLQIGFVNVVPAQAKDAWQIGFWNHGGDFDHCGQIGVFNYVRDMNTGVQIGLINIIEHNEYPCVPIMNCHF